MERQADLRINKRIQALENRYRPLQGILLDIRCLQEVQTS